MQAAICDPASTLNVKPQQIRVELFPYRDEVGHERDAQLTAEQSHQMKVCGICENGLRFGQSAGNNCVENDGAYHPNESKRLAYSHEQFRTVVGFSRPGAGVGSIQTRGKRHAGKSNAH